MRVKILLEGGLFERRDLRSGRIYREGTAPEYGVIFTANEAKTEDDLGLDTKFILDSQIGRKHDDVNNRDRFFKILGGYFYHDNYPDPGIVTKVFGIALQPEFGIREGESITLNDKWKLEDPEKPILDESYWSEKFGKHHGWTFIVPLDEREKYPTSDEEMKIFVYCPEIISVTSEMGNCELDIEDKKLKRKITYKFELGEQVPKEWIFHFGDGKSKTGPGKPPEKINHLYDNRPKESPKLVLSPCQPAADEAQQEINMSEFAKFEPCPGCPKIKDIQVKVGEITEDKNQKSGTVTFTPLITGANPDILIWYFGDGTSETYESGTSGSVDHYYEGKPKSAPKLVIRGPGVCEEDSLEVDLSIFENFDPDFKCPRVKNIEVVYGECKTENGKRLRKVSLIPLILGDNPDRWIWEFGDGSTDSGEAKPPETMDHYYQNKPEIAPKLRLIGPGSCEESSRDADLSGFEDCPPCPKITDIQSNIKHKDENTKTVDFTIMTTRRLPEKYKWDWGDNSPKETGTKPGASHDYKIPAVGTSKYMVKISVLGPDDCVDEKEITIKIPSEEVPEIPSHCFFSPLIVALFMAVAFGTLLVYNVFRIYQPMLNVNWLGSIILVLAIFTFLAIIFWYRFGKSKNCPKPGVSDWLGIGWIVVLSCMLVAVYLHRLCEGWWWSVVAVFLLLAGYLFYLWIKATEFKIYKFLFNLFICLLATAFVMSLVALY